MIRLALSLGLSVVLIAAAGGAEVSVPPGPTAEASSRPVVVCKQADGYRGIWYSNQPSDDVYRYKYSGGLGTYCAKHIPLAVYAAGVNKTFFVYGGMPADGQIAPERRTLLIMVSYYDHATGKVPRPRILMDKKTADAHDNATIVLDEKGHVWVFVSAHGTARPSYIYRSVKPYDIDAFELVKETNFSYPQPWYIEGKGFLFLHTLYKGGQRQLHFMKSPDGVTWSEPKLLARMGVGHYQISWQHGNKVGTAFNYHPEGKGLNFRTNLYYLETTDFGRTWQTAGGEKVELPLTSSDSPARVRDYGAVKRLVYLKDLNFDARGNPVILCLLSKGYQAGPENGRRFWTVVRWAGNQWLADSKIQSDNNYDMGSLYLPGGSRMEIIAPVYRGPQPFNPGGEMVQLFSEDAGRSWRSRMLTSSSRYNHSYARRPVDAHPHFVAFWADGHGRQPSDSRLYFCDRSGSVSLLPPAMS